MGVTRPQKHATVNIRGKQLFQRNDCAIIVNSTLIHSPPSDTTVQAEATYHRLATALVSVTCSLQEKLFIMCYQHSLKRALPWLAWHTVNDLTLNP